jgi:hypothetical protein
MPAAEPAFATVDYSPLDGSLGTYEPNGNGSGDTIDLGGFGDGTASSGTASTGGGSNGTGTYGAPTYDPPSPGAPDGDTGE